VSSGRRGFRLDEPVVLGVGYGMERGAPGIAAQGSPIELTFEELFAHEHTQLFRALFLITGSVQEAEELMQDAFLKVWERWERVSAMDNPNGYLYRVAVNAARSRLRRISLAARRTFAHHDEADPFTVADLRDEIVRALAALPGRQRAALVLTELLDMPTNEAGKALGISDSTVRSLASQARQTLRGTMGDDDD
jgi:RNA polymerase sigma-70 factor (ECF subfamily)